MPGIESYGEKYTYLPSYVPPQYPPNPILGLYVSIEFLICMKSERISQPTTLGTKYNASSVFITPLYAP